LFLFLKKTGLKKNKNSFFFKNPKVGF